MAALNSTSTILSSGPALTTAPMQNVDDSATSEYDIMSILDDSNSSKNLLLSSPTSSTAIQQPAAATPTIRITRLFDIRRVHNSETELRLSFDVPADITAKELQVHIEHDKQEQPDLFTLRVAGSNYTMAKTFPLSAQSIDIDQITATLKPTTNELEIMAPKKPTEGIEEGTTTSNNNNNNPFAMAVEAIQALALSVSNLSWNSDFVVRQVPITTEKSSS